VELPPTTDNSEQIAVWKMTDTLCDSDTADDPCANLKHITINRRGCCRCWKTNEEHTGTEGTVVPSNADGADAPFDTFLPIHWQAPALPFPRRSWFKQCVLSTRQEQGPEEDRSIDPVSYRLRRHGSRIVYGARGCPLWKFRYLVRLFHVASAWQRT
jgi:hypothetical protein